MTRAAVIAGLALLGAVGLTGCLAADVVHAYSAAWKDYPQRLEQEAELRRLQIEAARAGQALPSSPASPSGPARIPDSSVSVYRAEDCIGAVVNGVCNGTISPSAAQPKRCYGEMINGQCTGPMF